MTPPDLDRLIQSWCDDCLNDSEAAELIGVLRASPQARERFREAARFHGLLHCAVSKWLVAGIADQAAHGAVSSQPGPLRAWLKWRTLASMAAGIALTLLCTDRGFGDRATRVLSQSALLEPRPDGEIRPGALPSGFPVKFGQWSGDESAIVAQPGAQGHALKHALLFKRAEREKSLTAGRAAACDVFRLVDLRAMKPVIAGGEATLELSAKFLDARTQPGETVIFVVRLSAYEGRPERFADQSPIHSRQEALSLATNQFESVGGSPSSPRTLRSVVTLHPRTDFALVHLVAFKPDSGGVSAAEFGEQYAQEVQLTTSVPSSSAD